MNNNKVKLVLFDLDGTVYLDNKLIPGAKDFLDKLDQHQIPYAFMTNNSSVAPPQYLKKLTNLTLNVTPKNILTSCQATTLMLKDLNLGPNIFVLGTQAFRDYLADQGYPHTQNNPTAVLVGFDRELDFDKYTAAVRFVTKGVPLVASHPDMLCPSADGPLPDAGVLLAGIKAATNTDPIAIAGKPNRWIVQLAQQNFNVQPEQIVIVGDRLQTDIKMAHDFNMRSILVLSGVTKPDQLKNAPFQPSLVANSIAELTQKHWLANLDWL